jgi:hypothetical protein
MIRDTVVVAPGAPTGAEKLGAWHLFSIDAELGA